MMGDGKKTIYELEERTLQFSKEIIAVGRKLLKDFMMRDLVSQVIRSGSSVGANYREANEGISKKDCIHRLRIARKECKETTYWLELLKASAPQMSCRLDELIDESRQIRNVLSAILKRLT